MLFSHTRNDKKAAQSWRQIIHELQVVSGVLIVKIKCVGNKRLNEAKCDVETRLRARE